MLCVRDAWLNQSARRTVGPFGFERFTPPHNFGIDEFVASWLHNYLWSTSTRAKVLSLEIKTCIDGFPPPMNTVPLLFVCRRCLPIQPVVVRERVCVCV